MGRQRLVRIACIGASMNVLACGGGNVGPGGGAPDTKAPSAPTNLTANALSSSSVNLSWTDSSDNVGVAGYRILRCTGDACDPTTEAATSSAATFVDTTLSAETAYTYAVAAYDPADNTSAISNTATATTLAVGELLFSSDWSTATGARGSGSDCSDVSNAAVCDGGRWSILIGNNNLPAVVAATGLDFPTTNVLRVEMNAGGQAFAPRYTDLPIPAVGESRYYRWYFRTVIPDAFSSSDTNTHPIQDGNAGGDINWMFNVGYDYTNTGIWNVSFTVHAPSPSEPSDDYLEPNNNWPNHHWRPPNLLKDVTYRFELQFQRTGVDTFEMHPRVYNSSDQLLYDDDDFQNLNGTATLATNPTFILFDINNLNGLNSGINGLGGVVSPMVIGYQGAFCVRADTWCGPFNGTF